MKYFFRKQQAESLFDFWKDVWFLNLKKGTALSGGKGDRDIGFG